MKISKTLYVTDRAEWRAWLKQHHKTEKDIWLIYYKKHTGRPRIPYDDAVEEALCFGWIDSTVKRIDDDKYAQRFTPRKDNSEWSDLNRERARKLVAEGRMTKAGLARINETILTGEADSRTDKDGSKELVIPPYFKEALIKSKKALDNFNNMAASYRRAYVRWVDAARRQETRDRRLGEAIKLLEANKKPAMK